MSLKITYRNISNIKLTPDWVASRSHRYNPTQDTLLIYRNIVRYLSLGGRPAVPRLLTILGAYTIGKPTPALSKKKSTKCGSVPD